MATSINTAFSEFNTDTVNLLKDRSDKAKSSRDWLYTQLNGLQDKDDLNFPYKYELKHINYGSFERKTKIRELDDVDLMFCFVADGATYSKSSYGNTYTIHTPNAGNRLKYLSDSDILNSRKVVNKVKLSLAKIDQYKSADLHSKGEAVTLNLLSYEWVFDIVPCFYTDTDLYLIPDGNGYWKPTDPRIDQKRVTDANKAQQGRVLQLIRTLKYWNRRNSSLTIGSYLFENIVINYVNSQTELNQWIDFNLRSFFYYLSSAILNTVNDPKGYQGDLNTFTYAQRLSISQKADWAYGKADEAIKAEIDEKDNKKSINKWRELFGTDFPSYG
ncbi:SMODS domain-containing nucleotidyltransferase [Nonlabens xiamenensis]|uniref:SMODS domain-containing nucleotidyltransferase n=1 Tax=Nonlabens xiamenensis TaxID=2341043 RepID=UPI000F6121A2|nr:nucleotidyltransferase [Nonlabens xiamenensis]